jgi:hypothetical protein
MFRYEPCNRNGGSPRRVSSTVADAMYAALTFSSASRALATWARVRVTADSSFGA